MPTLVWWKELEEGKGQENSYRRRRKNRPLGDKRQGRLGKRGRNEGRPQENRRDGPKEVLEVEESIWEGRVRKDADKKSLGSCHRSQGDV